MKSEKWSKICNFCEKWTIDYAIPWTLRVQATVLIGSCNDQEQQWSKSELENKKKKIGLGGVNEPKVVQLGSGQNQAKLAILGQKWTVKNAISETLPGGILNFRFFLVVRNINAHTNPGSPYSYVEKN